MLEPITPRAIVTLSPSNLVTRTGRPVYSEARGVRRRWMEVGASGRAVSGRDAGSNTLRNF